MTADRAAFPLVAAFVLSGCIVAPCPKGRDCSAPAGTAPAGTGGATGAGGAGGVGQGGAGPHGPWIDVTGNLAGMDSDCGNMADLSAKSDEDMLIAGIAKQGLWATRDQGKSWQPLGLGSDSGTNPISNRMSAIVYDCTGRNCAGPTDTNRFWESGIYSEAGVFETKDDGATFEQLGDVTQLVSSRHSDLVSIDFSDPERKTLLAGGHEQSQTLYRSTDAGRTWTEIGGGLPDNTNCTRPIVIDSLTYLVGCAGYGGGVTGIFRTTDGGVNWTQVSESGGEDTPLSASDGSIYWASPNSKGLARSTDDGQTWTLVTDHGVSSTHPIELTDHRLAILAPGAAGVLVSKDHGANWEQATPAVVSPVVGAAAFTPRGVVYSRQAKAFYVWHFTCDAGANPVPPGAILRYDFDGGTAP